VLVLQNLLSPFEVETDASGYSMRGFLMHGERHVYYHSEVLHGVVLNYPTYKIELYDLVQAVKKWKHYLIRKDTIIQTYHQQLSYL
jgi:hypothetical protein